MFKLRTLLSMAVLLVLTTSIFARNVAAIGNSSIRTIVNEGGTSSSKTFSVLQALHIVASLRTKPLLISTVSESFPHLKLGAMRDFRLILGDSWDDYRWNATDHIYSYQAAQIEFFSADQPGKAHGPRRDVLFLNECINIPHEIADALIMRTRSKVIIDHNPTGEYWAHEMRGRPGVEWIHSTYLDAKHVLPAEIVAAIEARKHTDPNWWNVYGLGNVGLVEGLVHPRFQQVDVLPEGGDRYFGIDFGYSNDPTAIVHCVEKDNEHYSDEILYERGLDNIQIVHHLEQAGVRKEYDEIFADAAEPKSIAEIHSYGYNIKPAPKGEDSVRNGIQSLNTMHQYWTKRSVNGIKEQRNYRYVKDLQGKFTNKPSSNWNHLMDARRYGRVGFNKANSLVSSSARIAY